jgi:1,4-dihydroxy-2-naphthoyl-CoA hydrolase
MSEQPGPSPDAGPRSFAVTVEQANRSIRGGSLGSLIPKLGIEFVEIGPAAIVARMPVEGNTQPYGILHGGATAALLETIASFGGGLLVEPDRLVMGIELNVNHIRSVRSGFVSARGIPLHIGRTTAVWDMRVHDDEGRLVAAGRLTLAVLEQPRE